MKKNLKKNKKSAPSFADNALYVYFRLLSEYGVFMYATRLKSAML